MRAAENHQHYWNNATQRGACKQENAGEPREPLRRWNGVSVYIRVGGSKFGNYIPSLLPRAQGFCVCVCFWFLARVDDGNFE